MPLNRYLQFALNSHFAERNIYIAVITRHIFFPFWTAKKFTSLLFFEHIMYTFFDRVCEMKSQFWHSFKWNVACIEWKSDCIKCKCVSKYTPNTNCEANNGVENRGKFFDSDYFQYVQSQRKPKQINARANDIKRVRILIQTDIIAEPPPMMIAIFSRLVFYFSRALFLARAPNASPHVYVILFAKQRVWVPHLNWDALHISNARRYSHRTHSLIMIISANTFRYTKWVKRRNFPFAWNSQTCIVHTILLMGSKFNRKRCIHCISLVFNVFYLRVLIASVPTNRAVWKRSDGKRIVVRIRAIHKNTKTNKRKDSKQVDNIYRNRMHNI